MSADVYRKPFTPDMVPESLNLPRFQSRIERTLGGCWLWTGTVCPQGYGEFRVGKPKYQAHRLAYVLDGRTIPAGYVLDHICRVRNCVNPDHLRPLTDRENVLLGVGPTAKKAQQVCCSKGHPLDEANTYVNPRGMRRCRTCHAEKERLRQAPCELCGAPVYRKHKKRHDQRHHAQEEAS